MAESTHDAPPMRRSVRHRSGPRAIALDYDGTLTLGERPDAEVLDALARIRSQGISPVLVSGRILAELTAVFPDVSDHFDALVLENGAVIVVSGRTVEAAAPIDPALGLALTDRGVDHRRGLVIVATSGRVEHTVLDEVSRLGIECQLVHNRSELMVLPSGVNKGTGLLGALGALGISRHDCVAVGDAENDHSLIAAAEHGVAVANAVDSLKHDADLVLDAPNGAGIVALLDDVVQRQTLWPGRDRFRITIGRDETGQVVELSARPVNMVITGGSGGGKSYLAGLIAEQLVEMDYSVLIVDPEGEHSGLDSLRSSLILGGDGPPPPVDVVAGLFKRIDACIVVDLSSVDDQERSDWLTGLATEMEACRRTHGRPHWVFFDEAHQSLTRHEATIGSIEPSAHGYCLVTWQPNDLPNLLVASTEVVLALCSPEPEDDVVGLVAGVADQPKVAISALLRRPVGHVVVARRGSAAPPIVAELMGRQTPHFRHEHKYDSAGTPPHRSFFFRDGEGRATGVTARNVNELRAELAHCDRSVVRHHAILGDFSRWTADVFHDAALADALDGIERSISSSSTSADVDATRLALIAAIHQRRSFDAHGPPDGREPSS